MIINCVDFSYHVCFNFNHYSVWLDGKSFSVCRGGQGLHPCPVALLYLNKQMQACAVHIKTYTEPCIDTNVDPQIAHKKGFNTKGQISLIQRQRDGNELS